MTADGSDDDKIKLESAPVDYKLDLAAAAAARAAAAATSADAMRSCGSEAGGGSSFCKHGRQCDRCAE